MAPRNALDIELLSDIRERSELFDFALRFDDQIIRVHRLVLALHSEYFRALFRHGPHRLESYVLDVDSAVAQKIIDYCYTGDIEIGAEDGVEIIRAASMWIMGRHLTHFSYHVSELIFISRNILRIGCLEIMRLAEDEQLMGLMKTAVRYCVYNLPRMVLEPGFSDSDFYYIIDRIKMYRQKPRKLFYFKIETEEHPACMQRCGCSDQHNMLSHNGKEWDDNEAYTPTYLPRDTVHGFEGGFVVLNQSIYMIGGRLYVRSRETSKVLRFDTRTETWHQDVSKMPRARSNMRAVVVNGCIYVIGGSSHGEPVDWVDRYDPMSDTWTSILGAPKRTKCAVAAHGSSIYMVGGQDEYHTSSRSCFRFDTRDFTWYRIAELNNERESGSLCSCAGRLYAIGGCSDSVEVYDEIENDWIITTRMNESSDTTESFELHGAIVTVGISTGSLYLELERFNPDTKVWTTDLCYLGVGEYPSNKFLICV